MYEVVGDDLAMSLFKLARGIEGLCFSTWLFCNNLFLFA